MGELGEQGVQGVQGVDARAAGRARVLCRRHWEAMTGRSRRALSASRRMERSESMLLAGR